MKRLLLSALFIFLIVGNLSQTLAQDSIIRVNADYDESSCICGLNSNILDRLEAIVHLGASSCANEESNLEVSSIELDTDRSPHLRPQEINDHTLIKEDISGTGQSVSPIVAAEEFEVESNQASNEKPMSDGIRPEQQVTILAPSSESSITTTNNNNDNNASGVVSGNTSTHTGAHLSVVNSHTSSSSSSSVSSTSIEKLTIEIQRLEQQIKDLQQESTSSEYSITSSSNKVPMPEVQTSEASSMHHDEPHKVVQVVNTGFLNGLTSNSMSSQNEALMKLNQSMHIDPHEMENALQSTIPNVVSNIFSNIENLTIQTEQQQSGAQSTSMLNGNLIVKGNTTAEILESGEQLFLAWIEHQLETLHLTASTANYIRKSAFSLFKKIVKQYVDRVSRVGDSLEDNMRRATQMALNNTQSLTGYLLKNYINFAGGLMQIIGDQVSRVGKQLDATGDSIAHIRLNPFDIMSNVIESLPNPSDYSKYFRAFGKQLMGQDESNGTSENSQNTNTQTLGSSKPHGLISKTMGVLGKTLGTWLG